MKSLFRRQWRFLCAAGLACVIGVYSWHAATLGFALHLSRALRPVGIPYSYDYTGLLGRQTRVWDSHMQDAADYESFVRAVGGGTMWGIGHVRDASTGVGVGLGFVLGQSCLLTFAAFLFMLAALRLARRGLRRFRDGMGGSVPSEVSMTGAWVGVWMLTPAVLVTWYLAYPRADVGQGVFQMHGLLALAGPATAGFIGLLAGGFDAGVEARTSRPARRCARCGFPAMQRTPEAVCTDCGFLSTNRNIGRLWAWRIAKVGMVGATILAVVVCLRIGFGPHFGTLGREQIIRWITITPMTS